MKLILSIALLAFSFANLHALSIKTKVYDVVKSSKANEPTLILAWSGEVYRADTETSVEAFTKNPEHIYSLEFNDSENVTAFKRIDKNIRLKPQRSPNNEPFYLSNFRSDAELSQVFNGMIGRVNGSAQCFDKAHFWAYEWAKKGYHVGKAFLFFTTRYIREYNYKWWFHVAPTLQANSQVRVMDRYFEQTPLSLQNWTNDFVSSKVLCPQISHYDQYYLNQESNHCYVRHLPMYYYHPSDIQNRDRAGHYLQGWVQNYLYTAYTNVGYKFP